MRKDISVCQTNSCPHKWTFFNAHTIARHLFSTAVDRLAVFSCFLLAQLTTYSPCSRSWINTAPRPTAGASGYQGTLHEVSTADLLWGMEVPPFSSRTPILGQRASSESFYTNRRTILKSVIQQDTT